MPRVHRTVRSVAQAPPKHGAGQLERCHAKEPQNFLENTQDAAVIRSSAAPARFPQFPAGIWGSTTRAGKPTAVTAHGAEAMPIGAPPQWNFPGGLRPRAEANAGTRLRHQIPVL